RAAAKNATSPSTANTAWCTTSVKPATLVALNEVDQITSSPKATSSIITPNKTQSKFFQNRWPNTGGLHPQSYPLILSDQPTILHPPLFDLYLELWYIMRRY